MTGRIEKTIFIRILPINLMADLRGNKCLMTKLGIRFMRPRFHTTWSRLLVISPSLPVPSGLQAPYFGVLTVPDQYIHAALVRFLLQSLFQNGRGIASSSALRS